MAILTISEKPPPYPERYDQDGLSAARAWDIVAESEVNARAVLYTETGVARGTVYMNHQGVIPDTFCVCQRLTARGHPPAPVGGTGLYEVLAEYAYSNWQYNAPTALDAGPGQTKFWVERTIVSEPEDHALNALGSRWDVPIQNSADEPIDPPVTPLRIQKTLVAQWIQYFDSYETAYGAVSSYEDKLNDALYQGAPNGSLLCIGVDVEEAGIPAAAGASDYPYRFTARFAYKAPKVLEDGYEYEGWTTTRRDEGRRTKGEIVEGVRDYPAILKNSMAVSDPVPLNGGGQELPAGATTVVLAFKHYKYANFANLVPA